MKTTVSIISVNWNGAKHIENMLATLQKHANGFTYEVILVDNASAEADFKHLQTLPAKFPDTNIQVIQTGANLGFGKGNNIGVKTAQGDFVAFVNPDITFHENTLTVLLDELRNNPKIGLIGPKLTTTNRQVVTSAMKKSTIGSIALGQTFLTLAQLLKLKTWGSFYVDQTVPCFPDWIYGSFMMLPRKVFDMVSGFDERYFMYAEEADLCLAVKKAGYLVRYLPTTTVFHEGEAVARKVPDLTIKRKAESEYKFFTKWNGKLYATLNALFNGTLFVLKGVLSFFRRPTSQKLLKMGIYRLKQL